MSTTLWGEGYFVFNFTSTYIIATFCFNITKPFFVASQEKLKNIRFENRINIKGKSISEWIYEVIISPKYEQKIVKISSLNPDDFWVVFNFGRNDDFINSSEVNTY